jgi:hypothetical protein
MDTCPPRRVEVAPGWMEMLPGAPWAVSPVLMLTLPVLCAREEPEEMVMPPL